MEEKVRETIEEIMGELRCPNNFKCAESGFEMLCRARQIGLEDYLECLESDPPQCKFASPFLDVFLCKCPVRGYVFEKLNK
ncbi:MAG: hypothetical protein ACYTE3_10440 [Planctomycetota bacterium]|jgi:hypothetical protein